MLVVPPDVRSLNIVSHQDKCALSGFSKTTHVCSNADLVEIGRCATYFAMCGILIEAPSSLATTILTIAENLANLFLVDTVCFSTDTKRPKNHLPIHRLV